MPKFQFKTAELTILIKQTISRPAGVTVALTNAKSKFVKTNNFPPNRLCNCPGKMKIYRNNKFDKYTLN
jgi:hypothetical protein